MSSTAHLDQAALANLTAEEREAFNESEYSASELEAMKRLAGDDGDDGADEGDPNEVLDANGKPIADVAQPAKAAEAKPDTAAAEAAAETPAKAAPEPAQDKQHIYKAALPEDFDTKVKDLAEKSAELRAQFKGGEIDFDAFEEQNAALQQDREALTMARAKAEISQEMTQQNAETQWNNAINRLYSSAKTDGVDYKADQERNAELDQFVKVLANNPAHQDKSMDWFLTEAHKRVMVLNGKNISTGAQQADPAPKPAAQNRNPPAAPKSIAHIPGGDGPGDVGGEFAHLDALDGNDLESAIAKMSPAQREKYSRGG
jgi:uncharacterized protein YeaO (DUF488 family)